MLLLTSCNQSDQAESKPAQAPTGNATAVSATPGKDASLPDPCTLLTKEEAQTILGEAVRDPQPSSLGGNKICDYKTVAVHGGVFPYSIHIALIGEQQQVWDSGKKLHQQSDAKGMRPVPGVGEDAYYLLDDLEVYTKQRYVSINVMKSIDKPNHAKAVQEAELSVAQKAIPRMQ